MSNSYNQIKFKAGITIPLPIMPIDIGVTLELKDALEETLTDDEIFQRLVEQAILDGWLADPNALPDGVRNPGSDSGERGGDDGRHPSDSGGGSGEGAGGDGDGGQGGGSDGTDN